MTLNGLFGCIFDVRRVNFFGVSRVFRAIPTTQYDRLSDFTELGEAACLVTVVDIVY